MKNIIKLCFVLSCLFIFSGCQSLCKGQCSLDQKRPECKPVEVASKQCVEKNKKSEIKTSEADEKVNENSRKSVERIGVILGPGGARSLALAGVLKSFSDLEVPIQGMVGIEWGSLVMTLTDRSRYVNGVQWQLTKLSELSWGKSGWSPKAFLKSPQKELKSYLKMVLQMKKSKVALPMACPYVARASKGTSWVMNQSLNSVDGLFKCMSSYPLFSWAESQAGLFSVVEAAHWLRQKGATKVVMLSALPKLSVPIAGLDKSKHQDHIWKEWTYFLDSVMSEIDDIWYFDNRSTGFKDFDQIPQLLLEGQNKSKSFVSQLKEKWRL